jgi:hypothetical protein
MGRHHPQCEGGTAALPNHRLQPTASSVRSCLAPASGSGSGLAFGYQSLHEKAHDIITGGGL